eukprot:COSAG01_NODE_6367_length_3710_cov_4.576572_2_plen_108_part_00
MRARQASHGFAYLQPLSSLHLQQAGSCQAMALASDAAVTAEAGGGCSVQPHRFGESATRLSRIYLTRAARQQGRGRCVQLLLPRAGPSTFHVLCHPKPQLRQPGVPT